MGKHETGRIQAIYRFSAIVEALCDRGPLTSREVANEIGVAKSTAHAYLATMEDLEHVVRNPAGYSLSLSLLDYGMSERDRFRVVKVARNSIEQLAEDTKEAVYLVVEEHGWAVYIDYVLGERAVKTHARLGTRATPHSLASGRAILAHLSEDRVEEILDAHGLPAKTENTITTREALYEDFRETHKRGYTLNEHEESIGTRAVGAPIVVGGEVIAAIAVSGPADRLTQTRIKDELSGEVLATTNEIELMLQR